MMRDPQPGIVACNGPASGGLRQHQGGNQASGDSFTIGNFNQTNSHQGTGRSNAQRYAVPASKPDEDLATAQTRKKLKTDKRLLACPIAKNCETYDSMVPCGFKGAANMWAVRQHLKSKTHREALPFLVLCRNCWQYIISEEEYNTLHVPHCCIKERQPRQSGVVAQWESLYGKLFPLAERIPSACKQTYEYINSQQPLMNIYIDVDDATWRTRTPEAYLDQTVEGHNDFDFDFDFNETENVPSFSYQHTLTPQDNFQGAENTEVMPNDANAHQSALATLQLSCQMYNQYYRQSGDLGDYHMQTLMNIPSQPQSSIEVDLFAHRLLAGTSPMVTRVTEPLRVSHVDNNNGSLNNNNANRSASA
jgi:hypothetical protein